MKILVLLALAVTLLSQMQKPAQTKKPAASPARVAMQASLDRGKKVYLEQCLACYQADGGGGQNMKPPLIKTKWVLGDKTTLVQVVLKGMMGEVDIDGETYHNVMAPHND